MTQMPTAQRSKLRLNFVLMTISKTPRVGPSRILWPLSDKPAPDYRPADGESLRELGGRLEVRFYRHWLRDLIVTPSNLGRPCSAGLYTSSNSMRAIQIRYGRSVVPRPLNRFTVMWPRLAAREPNTTIARFAGRKYCPARN